jgi:radical SAM protein with 4Fe4S-binding SPASM domain
MYDINFFEKSNDLKKKITGHLLNENDCNDIIAELDTQRSKKPKIYNIETTNYCNMKCVMCPRTMYMTRKNIWIDDSMFENLTDNIKKYSDKDLNHFFDWVENDYKQSMKEVSENGFYFSVVSQHLVLHGFGEPFLDKNLLKRINTCTKKNIPTYFSCTPATMTLEKAEKAMMAGLGVLKFSLDALDEKKIQEIRGKKANFKESIDKILHLIEFKKKNNLNTLLVPCMIDLSMEETDTEMHKEFLSFWKDKDVFAYIKSQDNRWLYENDKDLKSKSHYSKQYCEYPWLSLSVMADGNVVPCTQISNSELVMGNINENTLEEIWNGENYTKLRQMHVDGSFPKGHKCKDKCDMKKLYQYLK